MTIELMSIEFQMRVTCEVGKKNMIFPFKQIPVQSVHFNSMKCTRTYSHDSHTAVSSCKTFLINYVPKSQWLGWHTDYKEWVCDGINILDDFYVQTGKNIL